MVTRGRSLLIAFGFTLIGLTLIGLRHASSAVAQIPAVARTAAVEEGWIIETGEQVDAWYHAIAVIGPRTPGALPLYAPGYADRIETAKGAGGVGPGSLEQNRVRWRAEMEQDSIYEFLHFLPLYFASSSRESMLEALRAVVAGAEARRIPDPAARFGGRATAYVLDEPRHRTLLGELVDAIEEEWESFFERYRTEQVVSQRDRLESLQETWTRELEPSLAPYLRDVRMDAGLMLLSSPVGTEGRVLVGDPLNRSDNVLVVRLTDGSVPLAELYMAVRELCYPLVHRTLEAWGPPPGARGDAERVSQIAAVRAGALLLERFAPEHVPGYWRTFVGEPRVLEIELPAAFDRRFRLAPEVVNRLRGAIRAIPGG